MHTDSITTQHSCYRRGHNHPRDNCPAYNQQCHNCNRLGHFSHLCRSRNTQCTNSYQHSRYNQRQPRSTNRSSSRSSSTSPKRNKSHSRCRSNHPHTTADIEEALHHTRFTPSHSTLTRPALTPMIYLYNLTNAKTEFQKLFTFPTFSNSEDSDTTYNELLLSEAESSTSCRLSPDDTNFSPFQDHSRHLPRPSCIPVPTKKIIKPHSTQSKENKNSTHIYKAKPSCIPVYKDTKHVPVIRDNHPKQPKKPQTSNNSAVPSNQTTAKQPAQESPQANTHSSRPGSHLYCQYHLHPLDKQLFQDHHNTTAADTSIIHTFQELRMYQSARDNDHHYFHYHHIRYQHFQDHTHLHKNMSYCKYLLTYQFYYCIQVISSPHYNTCMQHKDKEEKKTQSLVKHKDILL